MRQFFAVCSMKESSELIQTFASSFRFPEGAGIVLRASSQ